MVLRTGCWPVFAMGRCTVFDSRENIIHAEAFRDFEGVCLLMREGGSLRGRAAGVLRLPGAREFGKTIFGLGEWI
ncbi:MAG: hypothetical protein NZ899_14360 [Thermoguttaceae bacterium]|nr:hypothetical protein [Thermoguttaceae bacterium]